MAGLSFASSPLRARQTSQPGSNQNAGSNSASGIVSTLIPVLVIGIIVLSAFLYLRTRYARVYRPRSDGQLVQKHALTPQSDRGFFGLIRNYQGLPDNHILQHNSIDGYLFLRYFKVLIGIAFVGACITWPILFPVNATGGGGQSQLDILSFSNVAVANANRYYAHALVSWLFLGFIALLITYERLHFIGLRQAYFLSAFQAQRLSSRTVLFMSIPKEYMTEGALHELFGSNVRKIWLAKDCEKLQEEVDERNKAANKLEAGQVKLATDANKARLKAAKAKGSSQPSEQTDSALPEKWLDTKKRPTHKLKFLIGKKVDTINYCREEIPRLNEVIEKMQNDISHDDSKVQSSAFVEFTSQAAAQHAFQLVAKKPRTKMNPRYIGVTPDEVIWKNMKVTLAQRKTKMALATTFVTLTIIFWTIPVAFVGAVSNINYLTNLVPFLSFIDKCPKVILGLITGLLPTILLAVLVALVPIIFRLLAKVGGEPTLSAVELKTQSWYFGFQVVQVFLVTTFTSGAASVVTQIISQPAQAPTLLATNLPKASNFYISFFILYGIGQATMQLLNVAPLAMIVIVGKFLDKTPRKQYNRWISMIGLGWGSEYPKWTNLGVIAISYAMIAPLVLGFATIGFGLLYIAFRYKWLFIFGNKIDMKGAAYIKALKQLWVGVYLSAGCLIGLFAIGTSGNSASAGPLVLEIIFLVALIAFQVLTEKALGPLEQNLPLDMLEKTPHVAISPSEEKEDFEMTTLHNKDNHYSTPRGTTESPEHVAKPSSPDHDTATLNKTSTSDRQDLPVHETKLTRLARKYVTTHYTKNQNFISAWPESSSMIPTYSGEDYDLAYYNPALSSEKPIIWLARDEMGISRDEKTANEKAGIETSDDLAWFNEKNKVEWDTDAVEKVPIRRREWDIRY